MTLNLETGLKILGERNTGTNFLHQIISENYNIKLFPNTSNLSKEQRNALPRSSSSEWTSRQASKEILRDDNHFLKIHENGGWKHAAVTENFVENFARPSGCAVICLVRHPASWSTSMHRNPFHGVAKVPRDYSSFLRAPWICVARDELSPSLQPSPLALYRKKIESYEYLKSVYENTAIVRYEDVLLNTDPTFSRLGLQPFQHTNKIDIPKSSSRNFGKGHLLLSGYQSKAKKPGYDQLSDQDRELILGELQGSLLLKLYPE